MCLKLYVHNTPSTPTHESRWPSILNPRTRWAVYSPFQDPYLRCCPTPCLPDLAPHERCPWHRGCCRLETFHLSCVLYHPENHPPFARAGSSCPRPAVHMHLYSEEHAYLLAAGAVAAANNNGYGFLDHLLACDPLFLAVQNGLFLAGVELLLASKYHRDTTQRLDSIHRLYLPQLQLPPPLQPPSYTTSSSSNNNNNNSSNTQMLLAEAGNLERAAVPRWSLAIRRAESWLGELAGLWDRRQASMMPWVVMQYDDFVPRPGREADPRANTPGVNLGMYSVLRPCHDYACCIDAGPVVFPSEARPRPGNGLERHVLFHSQQAHSVIWAGFMPVVQGNTIVPGL